MNSDYVIRLESFEGPLDLLLHLLEKNEMDIYNIPISEITSQYMEYIETMQELQLDVASEFIVMAATLLAMKSNMLLPKPAPLELDDMYDLIEETIDPRQLLMERLIEYKKFKQLAVELQARETHQSQIFSRPPADLSLYTFETEPNPVQGVSLYDLVDAFHKVLLEVEDEPKIARIRRDEVSVKERIVEILEMLRTNSGTTRFTSLLSTYSRRSEIVVTFLAILELIKNRKIRCVQSNLFAEIELQLVV